MRLRRVMGWGFLLVMLIVMLSACAAFEDPSQRATQNAEGTAVRATISVADRQAETIVALRSTADNASLLAEQGTQVSLERDALRATLNALNFPQAVIPGGQTGNPVFVTPQPSAVDGGVPAGPVPTVATQSSQYVQATTSSLLGADYCAADAISTFTTEAKVIYFVTVGRNVAAGTAYSLRISQGGQVVNTDENFWISDAEYPATCIYYAIDRGNMAFEAGTYTVELLANNQPVSQAVFTINAAESMQEGNSTGQ